MNQKVKEHKRYKYESNKSMNFFVGQAATFLNSMILFRQQYLIILNIIYSKGQYQKYIMSIKQVISNFSANNLQQQLTNVKLIEEDLLHRLSTLFEKIQENLSTIQQSTSSYKHLFFEELKISSTKMLKVYNQIKERQPVKNVYKCCSTHFQKQEMINHLQKRRISHKDATHFLTKLGNLVKMEYEQQSLFDMPEEFHQGSTMYVQNEKASTKKKNRDTKEEFINTDIKQTQQVIKKQIKASCGCGKQFTSLCSYIAHMRTHKFTIPEGSSHFVYRTQSQNIYCLIDEESNRIYKCPCKGDKEFSHSEFVPHVMKWHKGISPLLKH